MTKSLVLSLVLFFTLKHVTCYSLSNDDSLESLTDWDSSLYGKPICRPIPSNMSLCKNINYQQMRVPNLLGHDALDEIEYQSSAWSPLLSIKCHKETQLFLCSLFAPVCVEQSPATSIYPCRSLCESVRQSCEGPMLKYSYPWPDMFNCTKFPEDNGLCIKSSDGMVQEATTTTTTTPLPTTTPTASFTTTATISKAVEKWAQKPSAHRIQQCSGCDESDLDMAKLVRGYCKSDLVFRGRIQSIKISRLAVSKFGQTQRARNKSALFQQYSKPMSSLYVRVGKRDRKILKGHHLLSLKSIHEYLGETGRTKQLNRDLDVFLMSKYHMSTAGVLGHHTSKVVKSRARSLGRKRFADLAAESPQQHCTCDSLKKNAMRFKTKYFIMANVLRTKSLSIDHEAESSEDEEEGQSENMSYSKRYLLDYFAKTKWTRQASGRTDFQKFRQKKHKRQGKVEKLVYLFNLVKWNKARPLIDYLEDDTIQKGDMCVDIRKTVMEINRAYARLI